LSGFWHIVYLLRQEQDEEITVFILLMKTSDGGRNQMEVETLKYKKFLVIIDEF